MTPRLIPKSTQLPYALYRADQVRALDRQAIEHFHIPSRELMSRAGAAAFQVLRQRWPDARFIVILTGLGNNAGDGFVLADLACQAGLMVQVLQLGDRAALKGDALHYAEHWHARCQAMQGAWRDYRGIPQPCDVIVDAMLGTGLQRELRGAWRQATQAANAHQAPILALDMPTGLNADTGVALGDAIQADVTLSFIGLKQGMFTADGVDCCGDIVFDALQMPAAIYASQVVSTRRIDWRKQPKLSLRKRSAHKGHFGHVLVVGGDQGYGGAVRMAAEAAARCGAGKVSVATRAAHVAGLLAARPELMVHALEQPDDLQALLQQASVVVIGPGLGQTAWGQSIYAAAMKANRPMVVDADALNLLAEQPRQQNHWVLTPHPGEAARLLGDCAAIIHQDRFAAAQRLQRQYGGVAVLKGAGTLISVAGPNPPALCSDGNPGMASGGMGDVLSGVIGGLLAQGLSLQAAAESGVCLHAAAADQAAARRGERGLLASDLIDELPTLVNMA